MSGKKTTLCKCGGHYKGTNWCASSAVNHFKTQKHRKYIDKWLQKVFNDEVDEPIEGEPIEDEIPDDEKKLRLNILMRRKEIRNLYDMRYLMKIQFPEDYDEEKEYSILVWSNLEYEKIIDEIKLLAEDLK